MDKLKMESVNLTAQNIDKIGELFPNCITETADENGKLKKAINFDMLKQMLSDEVAEGDEAYEFTWVGKKEAIVEANKPIRKTLRPCKEESVDWDSTENLYIEGDNLEVLKLLQESYLGKVKMIYIDPPYNTGNDSLLYPDDYSMSKAEYEEEIGLYDEEGNKKFKENNKSNPRFHSDWLSMIYSRLMLARNLLNEKGVIYISIGNYEVDNLRKICDEIFGENNFVSQLVWTNNEGGGSSDSKFFKVKHEYILCYAKNITKTVAIKNIPIEDTDRYKLSDEYVNTRGNYQLVKLASASLQYSQSLDYAIETPDGNKIFPKDNTDKDRAIWRWSKEKLKWGYDNNFLEWKKDKKGIYQIYTKQYTNCDKDGNIIERTRTPLGLIDKYSSTQGSKELFDLFKYRAFGYPKPIDLMKYLLERFLNQNEDIVLDFFSGSATTAHAVMQLNVEDGGNRKFIMVQLPEKTDEKSEAFKAGYKNICEIGKERIRRAGKKIKEENPNATNLDTGFRVLKLAETNMTDVYYSPLEINQQMLLEQIDNIKPDRTDLDLLFGCLIDWGIPLNMPYVSEKIDGFTVHTYNDGDLIACFDKNVSESVIKEIAKRQPLRAVFRDSSFADSPSKINVGEIFKMIAPDTRVRVI